MTFEALATHTAGRAVGLSLSAAANESAGGDVATDAVQLYSRSRWREARAGMDVR